MASQLAIFTIYIRTDNLVGIIGFQTQDVGRKCE